MSTDKEQMLRALKQRLEPELKRRRFTGSFPHYRRFTHHKTDVVSVHLDERASTFRLELAELPPSGFTAPNGVWVEIAEATTYDALLADRAKLTPVAGNRKVDFRFGGSLFLKGGARFDRAAESAIALLPQADAWWMGERQQPNIWAGG